MLKQPLRPVEPLSYNPHDEIQSESLSQPRHEDVMGQFPQLKTYNHGTAIFELSDDISRETIVKDLQNATAKITEKIPWLAQQVVHENVRPGHSGTCGVAPWPENAPPNDMLRIKDCSDLCPSYAELAAARAPVQMLDGKVISPVPGFPETYDSLNIGPAPSCVIQMNFIKGGGILTFSNQHNVMDGTGIFQVVALLAKCMNGGELSDVDIEQGNRERKTVIPIYSPEEKIVDHSYLNALPRPLTPPQPPKHLSKWAQVRFLKKYILEVKSIGSDPNGYDTSVPFISTGDAVSAIYWKCMARARVNKGQDPTALSKFCRAIDSRGVMRIPTEYMGQLVYFSPTWLTHQELIDHPISSIASRLRKDLNTVNTQHTVRSYCTYIAGIPDKTKIAYAGPFNRETDIASSSMSQASVVLDFGILGVPRFIRRPNFLPIPGTLYFYPPEVSGDLNLLICVNEFEKEALQNDELWGKFTEWIG